jgi:uncharacterized membrane protein (GlpM family)
MADLVALGLKALNGGLFVVAFALIGEVLEPKRFAGLFSAAPSVALGSLSIVLLTKGPADGRENATGMIVGAIALIVFCVVARGFVGRYDALRGSLLASVVWLAVAAGLYTLVLR